MKHLIADLVKRSDYHELMSRGRLVDGGMAIEIDDKEPQPVADLKESWPWWARQIAKRATPEDKGVGDTAARLIGAVGGDAFKSGFEALTGTNCGCDARQESLNVQFPYIP